MIVAYSTSIRNCYELGKKRHEKGESKKMSRRHELPAEDINGIAHRLEGIERYSDRKYYSQPANGSLEADSAQHYLQVFGKEIEIFESAEQAEVRTHAQDEEKPPRSPLF